MYYILNVDQKSSKQENIIKDVPCRHVYLDRIIWSCRDFERRNRPTCLD